jgi:lipopolysaccharide/colanic/teichoic acid biosynthesis glycosyltransferase
MNRWKRAFDVLIAVTGLMAAAPLLVIAIVGIRLSSPGPILYRAARVARDRRVPNSVGGSPFPERRQSSRGVRVFTIYKLRTMRANTRNTSPITAHDDARVFPFGRWLRAMKIDELPQLFNVIEADMSIVGPRPEAPEIVREHYTSEDLETLRVQPGVTSPGTLHYYTHCEALLKMGEANSLQLYVEKLLPLKLRLDRVYINRASVTYDVRIVLRTLGVIVGRAFGRRHFPDPPELAQVRGAGWATFITR